MRPGARVAFFCILLCTRVGFVAYLRGESDQTLCFKSVVMKIILPLLRYCRGLHSIWRHSLQKIDFLLPLQESCVPQAVPVQYGREVHVMITRQSAR